MSVFITTVLVAFVTAVLGLVSYLYQKSIDRQVELRNRKMKEYERYLTAFRSYTSLYDFGREPADNDEERIKAVNEYWLAYSNLFHIASDSVLLAVADFHKLAWVGETDLVGEAYDQEFKDLYAEIIVEMRKDAFQRTKLQKEQMENNLPFNFSQASKTAKGVRVLSPNYS
jgi:hypothetical protein